MGLYRLLRVCSMGASAGAYLVGTPRGIKIPEEKTMSEQASLVSKGFQVFMSEAPAHAQAWGAMVQGLSKASGLDEKTSSLAYLAVLAALGMEGGVPFHVQAARKAGASRAEVISSILIGLPAAGHGVTQVLPTAIAAYDAKQ